MKVVPDVAVDWAGTALGRGGINIEVVGVHVRVLIKASSFKGKGDILFGSIPPMTGGSRSCNLSHCMTSQGNRVKRHLGTDTWVFYLDVLTLSTNTCQLMPRLSKFSCHEKLTYFG